MTAQDPLTPTLSQQARLGELATSSARIRERMGRGRKSCGPFRKGGGGSGFLSPLGERQSEGDFGTCQPELVTGAGSGATTGRLP